MKKKDILKNLQLELRNLIDEGYGPFLAAIYDNKGNLIAKCANTVLKENCSLCHAEINTIKLAQQKLKTYDLSKHNLSIYITSEPCIMCLGAIMWAGIKEVCYSVASSDVEKITGFDEGFKPNWQEEFEKRNIKVYSKIEEELGIKILKEYVSKGKTIYKPQR